MSSANLSNEQVLDAVIARATEDRAFRARLLTDPRGAIQDAFAVTIPAEFHVRFIEREPDVDALIVLPALRDRSAPQRADGALSDDELESVSGGGAMAHAHLAWSRAIAPAHQGSHI